MNIDTKTLLEECNAGCKMAINSINQVLDFEPEEKMEKILVEYRRKHEQIQRETAEYLKTDGYEEKDPKPAASVFSWITTEMKMLMRDDSGQMAKLMMDGCNMGVQSIGEKLNKLTQAEEPAREKAKELIHTEESFAEDLQKYL